LTSNRYPNETGGKFEANSYGFRVVLKGVGQTTWGEGSTAFTGKLVTFVACLYGGPIRVFDTDYNYRDCDDEYAAALYLAELVRNAATADLPWWQRLFSRR
jgi:hypothetical protein